MVDEPKAPSQIRTSAHKSFDEARTATNGVAKTAALWAVALAIVWISGLEPTLHTVAETARAFGEINAGRQEAERRATIRLNRVAAEKEEVGRLKQFEQRYPHGDKRNQERARLDQKLQEATEKKNSVEKDLPETEWEASPAWQNARRAKDKAANEKREFDSSEKKLTSLPLAIREERLKAETDALAEESKRLKRIYAKARKQAQAQERNVSFELFGFQFKASPLLAPLLWCAFCVALLGYLAKARAKSIACCDRGIRTLAQLPCFSGDEIADLAERLPTWAVEPALWTYASALGTGKDQTLLAREPWVNRVFGSLSEQQFITASIFLIRILLWATELRVAWITLEFSRYLGTNWARALLPLALMAILGVTACVAGWWFFGEKWIAWLGRAKDQRLVGLSTIVLLLVTVSLLSWHPSVGIHFAFLLQKSLLWLATLPVGLLTVWVATRVYGLRGKANRIFPPTGKGFTRRGAMIAMAGFAALATLTISLPTLLAPARKTRDGKCKPLRITLKQGFYQKQPQSNGNTAKDQRTAFSFADILHYIGADGRFSQRGCLPSLESLTKVRAPTMSHVGTVASSVTSPVPRVHLATASWSFEEAVIAVFRQGPIGRKKSHEACQLLLCGIQHDLLFKQRINKERKKGRPSFRLYDLLAGVSVRYRQEESFNQLLEMIEGSGQRLVFQTRLEKWQDVTGPWRQRWRNRKKPVIWKGSSGAVVF